MLTSDLVQARFRSGRVYPLYLRGEQFDAALELAQTLINVFTDASGQSLEDLEQAVKQIAAPHPRPLLVSGFAKLLRDRCELEDRSDIDHTSLRHDLFETAATQRRQLGIRDQFDREGLLRTFAKDRNLTVEQLQSLLFSDLPGAQLVGPMRPISPVQLVQRYNLALAQGVLLRCTSMTIDLAPQPATQLRRVFHAIKFRRLMYRVHCTSEQGYTLEVDGPMSLLQATQRYGVQLALFLPALVATEAWELRANVKWGKNKTDALFVLSHEDGLVSSARSATSELPEIEGLLRGFSKLDCSWSVRRCTKIFHFPGDGVVVPDLVFEHGPTNKKVYFEAFGYWNRNAVFDRVSLLKQHRRDAFLLAVSKKLRVSPEITTDEFPGSILVYAQAISNASVLRILEQILESANN